MHPTSLTGSSLTLLLIEDSPADAEGLTKILQAAMSQPYTCTQVTTLGAALSALSIKEYDLVLLDHSLPDAKHFEALYALQSRLPSIPIIFLAAYKEEQLALEAIEHGAQDYLFKDMLDLATVKHAIKYALLRKKFEAVLVTRANCDMLTGLVSQPLFENRKDAAFSRMVRHGGDLAVIYLDIDCFRYVNNTMGHIAGDILLKQVAQRIRSVLRACDTAARLQGDKFVVLLEHINSIENAEIVARKLLGQFAEPYELQGSYAKIGVSLGISYAHTGHASSAAHIVDRATIAMYKAKASGGDAYVVYNEGEPASTARTGTES